MNLVEKFALFDEAYVPKIVGELNGQYVKLARLRGPYVWHDHTDEDELFLVVEGALRIDFRDRSVGLGKGEFLIVPRGVEHRPVADKEALVLLFEPKRTVSTGRIKHEYTERELEWI